MKEAATNRNDLALARTCAQIAKVQKSNSVLVQKLGNYDSIQVFVADVCLNGTDSEKNALCESLGFEVAILQKDVALLIREEKMTKKQVAGIWLSELQKITATLGIKTAGDFNGIASFLINRYGGMSIFDIVKFSHMARMLQFEVDYKSLEIHGVGTLTLDRWLKQYFDLRERVNTEILADVKEKTQTEIPELSKEFQAKQREMKKMETVAKRLREENKPEGFDELLFFLYWQVFTVIEPQKDAKARTDLAHEYAQLFSAKWYDEFQKSYEQHKQNFTKSVLNEKTGKYERVGLSSKEVLRIRKKHCRVSSKTLQRIIQKYNQKSVSEIIAYAAQKFHNEYGGVEFCKKIEKDNLTVSQYALGLAKVIQPKIDEDYIAYLKQQVEKEQPPFTKFQYRAIRARMVAFGLFGFDIAQTVLNQINEPFITDEIEF